MVASKGSAHAHGHSDGAFGHGGHHTKDSIYGKKSTGTHSSDHLVEKTHDVNLMDSGKGPGGMDM